MHRLPKKKLSKWSLGSHIKIKFLSFSNLKPQTLNSQKATRCDSSYQYIFYELKRVTDFSSQELICGVLLVSQHPSFEQTENISS